MSSRTNPAGWAAVFALLAAALVAREADHVAPPSPRSPRDAGTPFLTVWRPDDYGAQPENFCIVQHPATGLIYVGNAAGVLEFDGARWQLIRAPDNAGVIALGIDRRGRVWGTTGGSYFRLEPDNRGRWQARSLGDLLPAEARGRRALSRCIVTSEGVWFYTERHLICFGEQDGLPRTWTVAEGNVVALRLWKISDEPYVMIGGNVTSRVRAGALERVPGLNTTVWDARAAPDGTWRILTAYTVERWDGKSRTELGRLPPGDGAYMATFLADGRSVFGTGRRGLVVCDRDGRVVQTIGRAQGLPANQIVDVIEGHEGGVWVVTRNGLARLQLDSPYAVHGPAQGLEGTVHSLARQGNRLFAGGTEGVAQRSLDGRFAAVPDISTAVREVVAHDAWLFMLSTRLRGLRPSQDRAAAELENRNYFGLVPLAAHPGWMAHGANEGVRWARFDGDKWETRGPLAAIRGRAQVLLEAPAGIVWAAQAGGTWRVDFRDGLAATAPARRFAAPDGVPAVPDAMFVLGGEVVVVAGGGLLRYDEAANRFAPDTRVDGIAGLRLERASVSEDGTVWLQAGLPERRVVHLVADGDRWHAQPLAAEPLRHLKPTALYHEAATRTLWIGGAGALVSCDLAWRPTGPVRPPTARVRRIETATGELIRANLDAERISRLEPEQDSLSVHFAAPTFVPDHDGIVRVEYRTRLDGLEREWSAWSRQTQRDFTNLPWRDFTFRVQARDGAGRTGPEARLAFSIRPAWWATKWAWAGYGALGLAGLAGLVRLRTHALHRRAARLEREVVHRTRELAESNAHLATSNAELARLRQLDRDEKIAAQLSEEKARLEVLRYQLNPHFLYNSLNSIYGLLFEDPRGAGEMVVRLSEFCRATLTGAVDEMPTLGAEIAALRSYLAVEKVRWREKLQIEFDVAPETEWVRLPPFLLLPLVENAIKYGSRTSASVLRLTIEAQRVDDALQVVIANTGRWLSSDRTRPESTGIGLDNLQQRLRRYYPGAHDFSVAEKDGWVIASVKILRPAWEPAEEATRAVAAK